MGRWGKLTGKVSLQMAFKSRKWLGFAIVDRQSSRSVGWEAEAQDPNDRLRLGINSWREEVECKDLVSWWCCKRSVRYNKFHRERLRAFLNCHSGAFTQHQNYFLVQIIFYVIQPEKRSAYSTAPDPYGFTDKCFYGFCHFIFFLWTLEITNSLK